MSLIDTFVEAINTATRNMANYKEAAKNYTDEVDSGLDELEELIKRLSGCIKQLVDLQQDYTVYIQRISQIRLNMQTMLDQQITQAQTDSGEDCDNKIRGLLEKFNAFVQTIGTWEKEGGRFRELLDKLTKEIDTLCTRAEQIMMQNEDNTTRLEKEISELEAKLNVGNQGGDGASKEQTADNETKGGETREQQLARLARMEAELERKRQEQEQQTQQSQQRQRRTAQQERDARIAARRENMRARQQQRNTGPSDRFGQGSIYGRGVQSNENYDGSMARGQGARRGGWQTPQKLESISRYSPIRRVTRKKKNIKKKKKRRKKQTKKRRGKKRN